MNREKRLAYQYRILVLRCLLAIVHRVYYSKDNVRLEPWFKIKDSVETYMDYLQDEIYS